MFQRQSPASRDTLAVPLSSSTSHSPHHFQLPTSKFENTTQKATKSLGTNWRILNHWPLTRQSSRATVLQSTGHSLQWASKYHWNTSKHNYASLGSSGPKQVATGAHRSSFFGAPLCFFSSPTSSASFARGDSSSSAPPAGKSQVAQTGETRASLRPTGHLLRPQTRTNADVLKFCSSSQMKSERFRPRLPSWRRQ